MNLAANQASLSFLLSSACRELFPDRMLVIEHSFGDSYFCHDARWEPYTEMELESLVMKRWNHQTESTQRPRKSST